MIEVSPTAKRTDRMKPLSRLLQTSASLAAWTVVLAPGALAQATPSDPQSNDRVVVTAERREQDVQDVPIAVTVFDAEMLASRAVDEITDLQQVAPSIAINTVNRSTFVNIRGVGLAQTAPTSVPGVAVYLDGQLIPHEQFIRQSFYDFAAIEVLRGPQGTLNGLNSTGGAVYVRTPEPEFDEYSGYIDATVGNYDRYRAVGAVNVPLGGNLALRVSAMHEEMASFTDNIGPSPSNPGEFKQDAARANLAFQSDDKRFRLNLRGEYFDYESGHSAIKNRNDAVTSDPFVIEEDAISFLNLEGHRVSGEIQADITDNYRLRVLSSYLDATMRDQADGDRTATAPPRPPASNVGRVSFSGTDFETWMNEINLISTGSGPFQWVVGAFSMEETIPVFVLRDNNNTVNFVSSTSTIRTIANNKSYSIFGQGTYAITPQWEVLLGLRQNWDEQAYTRVVIPGPPPPPSQRIGIQESEETTGKVGVNFTPSDNALLYAHVAKGYKAGGVNLTPGQPNFGPETNLVYEGGFKLTLFGGDATLNGAAFFSDYKDIQFASIQAGLPVQQNAGDAESYGGEIEFLAEFSGFDLNLGVSYLHGEFTEAFCINNAYNALGNPACTAGNDLVPSGSTLPFAPEWTANAGIQYAFPLGGDLTFTPRAQVGYTSEQISSPFPRAETRLDERTIVDARLTLDIGDRYTIEAYGTNVLDETYIAAQVQNSSSSDGGILSGAPIQYGVRGVARF